LLVIFTSTKQTDMKKHNKFEIKYTNGKKRKSTKEQVEKIIKDNNTHKYNIESMKCCIETNNMTREELIKSFKDF
jgi:hypothetical protein